MDFQKYGFIQKSINGWVNGELIDRWINNSINQQRNGLIEE